MRKSLIKRIPKRGRIFIPTEADQIRIISGLLKLKHFHGIWHEGGTLSVRREFEGSIRYLPWLAADQMILDAALGRKPVESAKPDIGAENLTPRLKFSHA